MYDQELHFHFHFYLWYIVSLSNVRIQFFFILGTYVRDNTKCEYDIFCNK